MDSNSDRTCPITILRVHLPFFLAISIQGLSNSPLKWLITSLGAGDPGGKISSTSCKVPLSREPSLQLATILAERLAQIFDIPPNEQPAFLRFARGELHSQSAETQEDASWNTSAKHPRSNLPAIVTSLIGREREIADVRNYLLKDDIQTEFGAALKEGRAMTMEQAIAYALEKSDV